MERQTQGMFSWSTFIDLKKFFWDTEPDYFMYYCKIQHLDCRHAWKKISTLNGICAEFNPSELIRAEQNKKKMVKNQKNSMEFR